MDTDTDDVELTLDREQATAPDLPAPEAAGDPAAEAFARLEGEMALMRRAVQQLATERADIVIPDYGATLSEMTRQLTAVSSDIAAMAGHPALQLTPESLGRQINSVAEATRRLDDDRMGLAREELLNAEQAMRSVTAHARLAVDQRRQLYTMAGGLLAGVLLWSVLPGVVARAVPQSWHWPERVAARVLREPTIVDAGIRMIRSENPQMWEDITEAAKIADVNRAEIKRCRAAARKSGRGVNCTMKVGG
ncbi:hypothetical protein HGI47_21725 [Novosphingobium sp. ERN07]|uniref:DUF6118 family protein n=1 Tax=Novosphingobium sp. ERN07 TaxID=2726187 RepID=UPI001457540C|nr:DUF6118 family protein [Novosphingobium sp. ERN07]NLR73484.1 hypothetical protein [Novosphingobium sp. ERN07]